MHEMVVSCSHSRPLLLLSSGSSTAGSGRKDLFHPANRPHAKGNFPSSSINGRRQLLPLSAQRRPRGRNMNEDTDEMFDDLINKYGEVVYSRRDSTPVIEADNDDDCLSFAVTLAKVANDVKAADIRVLFVKPLVYWTRFFVIASAFSNPQIDAIGSRMREIAEKQFNKFATGDMKPNSWTLLDFGDVVVHIFLPQQRAFYNLEEFYGNAPLIELPFETETPPFRG